MMNLDQNSFLDAYADSFLPTKRLLSGNNMLMNYEDIHSIGESETQKKRMLDEDEEMRFTTPTD